MACGFYTEKIPQKNKHFFHWLSAVSKNGLAINLFCATFAAMAKQQQGGIFMSNSTAKIQKMVLLAMLIALQAILAFTPIGFIMIPPMISITLMHIPVIIGAVILGGIFEGIVGLSAKYWKRFLTPVVSACVVIAIGLSLLSVGMDSWGGGNGAADFGSWYHLLVGTFTLVVCLVSRYLLKGVYKNLNILVGLIFGYLLSVIFTVANIAPMVDFSGITKTIQEVGFFSIPKLVFFTSHTPVFDLGAFFTIAIVFLVSAAETTGATTAVCTGALERDIKMEELQGSLAVDGLSSAISGCFGCIPLTSFSQNVGLVTMTKVINRFTILVGALILILASLFPPLGAFFNSLPQAVLGGCTVMMFGSIMYEGIKMLKENEFDERTMIIVSLAFCIGVGLTQTSGNFFAAFPPVVGDIFNGNAVAGVFVVSLLLSLVLPKKKEAKK